MSFTQSNKQQIKIMLKQFFPLLIAIALQNLMALTVNLLDNFMLGAYSEAAMSGASVVNQIQFFLQQITMGIGQGVAVLGAQYWGKKQTEPIKKIISVGLKFAFVTGIIFSVVTAIIPRQVLGLITNEPEILNQGVEYLSIICWTYVIFAISSVLLYSLQGVETAFIGTIMSGCTIAINFSLNYILIFGNFGAPELGVRGAAYATLTSRIVELIIILIYILFIDKKLKIKFYELVRFKSGYLKDFFMTSIPMMSCGALWGISTAIQTAILGHMSAEAIGANSIAVAISQIFMVVIYASTNASSVVVGKIVGSDRIDLVKPYAKTLQLIFIIIGLVSAAFMFAFRVPIANLYNVSEETKELSITFLTILSVSMIGSAYEFPVMGGIIAGGGDTKYQMFVDIAFMWLLVLPMSFLSAFVFEWSEVVTFICLKADQIIKCIPNAIYVNSYKWIKNRTRKQQE